MMTQGKDGCCPNSRCRAGFQPALSRQDGGATFKLGQHPQGSVKVSHQDETAGRELPCWGLLLLGQVTWFDFDGTPPPASGRG